MRRAQNLAILFGMLLVASSSQASDYQSPRTSALGGAGHAGPLLNDSIYLNPSYAAFTPAYGIEGNFGSYSSPAAPDGSEQIHGRLINASVQDGRNQLFQAGVGYSVRNEGKLLNFGAAKAAIQQLGFGIGGKFYFPNVNNGPSVSDTIVSTTWAVSKWFQTAFIVDNAVETQSAQQQGFYREFILGTKLNIQSIILLYVDPHYAPDAPGRYGYEAGVELTPFTDLFFRAGTFRGSSIDEMDNTRGHGYGFGVGWVGPRVSFDYGLSHVVQPTSVLDHNFGMTIFF
jgi:hypothetical protein